MLPTDRIAKRVMTLLVLSSVSACAWPESFPRNDVAEMPKLLDGLGTHSRPIATRSPLAQRYFDQGLALTYGFNHAAAIEAFDAALIADPECAACFWGKALAYGPNINAPMGPEAADEAYAASQAALAHKTHAKPATRALIEALAQRYSIAQPQDRAALDLAYAIAMREVQAAFPDDVDIATLTAEALMDLYPWNYWDEDGEPREHTDELIALLEWVLAKDPEHLGANHYYIHAVEEFFPEKGEAAADRLASAAPDAGHLTHMPSHIYWRVGRYADAATANQAAIAADEQLFAWCRPGTLYRALYYPHNLHFLWAAASAQGQSELALSAARKLAQQTEPLHAEFAMVEEFISAPHLTLVRFGRWDAVLGEPTPPEGRPYQQGIWHYARGIAQARTHDFRGAEASLASIRAISRSDAAAQMSVAGGTATTRQILAIASAHLAGELAVARGDTATAIVALEQAVEQQDALPYMEPPPWYLPTRQALGAVLLEAGRPADAEQVYRIDLEQHPKNGWSLFGLAQSLEAQERSEEARWARQGFDHAWAKADIDLLTSRF